MLHISAARHPNPMVIGVVCSRCLRASAPAPAVGSVRAHARQRGGGWAAGGVGTEVEKHRCSGAATRPIADLSTALQSSQPALYIWLNGSRENRFTLEKHLLLFGTSGLPLRLPLGKPRLRAGRRPRRQHALAFEAPSGAPLMERGVVLDPA